MHSITLRLATHQLRCVPNWVRVLGPHKAQKTHPGTSTGSRWDRFFTVFDYYGHFDHFNVVLAYQKYT